MTIATNFNHRTASRRYTCAHCGIAKDGQQLPKGWTSHNRRPLYQVARDKNPQADLFWWYGYLCPACTATYKGA